ncbi:SURF1 family protein [Microbulbifer pacificus]|uniref:SURF1-like protein n=1 Tax=Microbulbifer pacificus TaxID=407164 RepID=A0AAU0MV33_9GAMM|nr:SURF1 family protein [Microbulbifer pacificus]WOX03931.1 SURF1 family protein [Microbulbifer pacificus]
MTAPRKSQAIRDNAIPDGTANLSKETGEPSRAASVAFIRSWPLSILCWCLFPLLLGLGNWQVQRAQEKQQILDNIDGRLSTQPINITELQQAQPYTPVRLLGFYTDEYFYLDNRTRSGRVGYEILQVFESRLHGDRTRWLINRGWMPAGSLRSQLPEVTYPTYGTVISGFLYASDPAEPDQRDLKPIAPQSRIQQLDTALAEQLNLTRTSWHIRLSADSGTALTTDWPLVNVDPQKHRAYALQWFAMAASLVVLWLLAATNARQLVREKWFKKSAKET